MAVWTSFTTAAVVEGWPLKNSDLSPERKRWPLQRDGPLWRGDCAVSTVVSIISHRHREKTDCLHGASKDQFGFPVHVPRERADSHIKMTGGARGTF